jgi:hypothetical protein
MEMFGDEVSETGILLVKRPAGCPALFDLLRGFGIAFLLDSRWNHGNHTLWSRGGGSKGRVHGFKWVSFGHG